MNTLPISFLQDKQKKHSFEVHSGSEDTKEYLFSSDGVVTLKNILDGEIFTRDTEIDCFTDLEYFIFTISNSKLTNIPNTLLERVDLLEMTFYVNPDFSHTASDTIDEVLSYFHFIDIGNTRFAIFVEDFHQIKELIIS